MSTFTYRIIKSSWGVHISLDAYWQPLSEFNDSSTKISEKLFFAQKSKFITEEEAEFLKLGLKLVADKIDELFKNKEAIVVVVQEVLFNDCDYQQEGLACAIMGWISREFNLTEPTVDVSFDRANNQYIFRFPNSEFSQKV